MVGGFPWQILARDNLRETLLLFIVDTVQCGLQFLGALRPVPLGLLFQLPVNFPPILGVFGFVWLAFPVWYITFDEMQPYLAVMTNDLRRVNLDLMLEHKSVAVSQ
jgi:hypothetical protein